MVPGSIPGGVTGFFSDIFPSDRIMALGSSQPLVKMSTRNIPGGKGGWCVRLTTYHHIVPMCMKSRSLNFLDSSGPAWPVTGVFYLYLLVYMKANENLWSYLGKFFLEREMFQTKFAQKIKRHFTFSNFLLFQNRAVYGVMKKNTVQPSRPQMTTWLMRIAHCITKATDIHPEYVTFIVFPRQQAFCERASVLRLYMHLPVLFQ